MSNGAWMMAVVVALVALGAWWVWRNRSLPLSSAALDLLWQSPQAQGTAERASLMNEGIPPVIWTYWHSPGLPLVVQRCVDNWRRHNPGYAIHVLHQGNLHEYLDDIPLRLAAVGIPKQTDWIRLALLHRHGGFWLDASTILTQSLDWAVQRQAASRAQLLGFYLEGFTTQPAYPVVESWFLAAPAGSAFVADWLALFREQAIDGETQDYLQGLRQRGVFQAYTQRIGDPAYHTIHVTAQHLMQSHPLHDYRLELLRAEDGPYLYHQQSGWKRRSLYWRLLWNGQRDDCPPLIKLRGGERRKLEPYLRHGWYRQGSLVGRQLRP